MTYLIYQDEENERQLTPEVVGRRIQELGGTGVHICYHADGIIELTDLSGEYSDMFKCQRLAQCVNSITKVLKNEQTEAN